VQVVEEDRDRCLVGRALDQRTDRLEQPEARGLALGQFSQVGEQRGQLGGGSPGVAAQRLHPRPVGRRAARLPAAPDEHPRAVPLRAVGQRLRQAALADPRLAGDQEQPPVPRHCPIDERQQLRQLALAADERILLGLARQVEARVLREDPRLELLQVAPWLEAQLLDERGARLAVDLEGISLAPRAVEREHQLGTEALARGMRGHEALELRDRVTVAAERQVGVDPCLERAEAQLLEPGNVALEGLLERQVRERRAAPELERVVEDAPRLGEPARRQRRVALVDRGLEPLCVEVVRGELELVAG
jgi:hypothetical protein